MSSLLYVIAVLFVIAWAIGVFVYSAGTMIHMLIVFAIVSVLLRFIGSHKPVEGHD